MTDWIDDDEEVTGVTRSTRSVYRRADEQIDSAIEDLLRSVT